MKRQGNVLEKDQKIEYNGKAHQLIKAQNVGRDSVGKEAHDPVNGISFMTSTGACKLAAFND